MSRCPNINSQEWKALEAQHGTEKALRLYAENGFDIPNVSRQDLNPQFINGKYHVNSVALQQTLDQNPKLAKKVFDHVAENFPAVQIRMDALIGPDGKWVSIPAGKRGMHYKNALIAAVAFANDATMETIPHEFAHEYIQMFRDTPVVQNAFKGRQEEEIVDQMGKFFINKATKNWFQNFIDDLMYSVRKVFGTPGAVEILAREYYKGKNQGQQSLGQGYISYQDKSSGLGGIFDNHRTRNTGSGFNTNTIRNVPTEDFKISRAKVHNVYKNNIMPMFMAGDKLNLEEFGIHINENILKIQQSKINTRKPNSPTQMDWNHASIDNDLIVQLQSFLKNEDGTPNDTALTNLANYLMGNTEIEYSFEETRNYNTLFKMHQAVGIWSKVNGFGVNSQPIVKGYQVAIANMLLTEPGKAVGVDSVVDQIDREITEQSEQGHKLGKKIKEKLPDAISDRLDTGGAKVDEAVTWMYDGFLLSKSLTGKNNSLFGSLFYDSLDHGVDQYADLQNSISEIKAKLREIPNFGKWGMGDIKDRNISEYETMTIESQSGNKLDITLSEAATIYFNLKQEDTRTSLMDKGFYLNDIIKGRSFNSDTVHTLSNASALEIIEAFESDPNKKMFIETVYESLNLIYDKVNPTYEALNGYELEKLKNFFPAYYGAPSGEVRKEKTSFGEFKSTHARMGADMPIRVGDAKSIMAGYSVSAGMFAAYSQPIRNNRLALRRVRSNFTSNKKITHRMEMWDGFLNKIEDPSLLYPSQGEAAWERRVNELMSNFAVFVLGYNPAVVIKQTASYMLAQEFVDPKYLKEAGLGFGPLMIPKLGAFFKALQKTKKNENLDLVRKFIPVEYNLDPAKNKSYAEILEHSSFLSNRAQGHTTRELSEQLMSMSDGKGNVTFKLPGMKKAQSISLKRAMEGIRVMDTVTIMSIWNAVKLQANAEIESNQLTVKKNSPEYWEHVSLIAEQAVKRTQPTSDVLHRSWLSSQSGVIPRTLTMFSSATQQQAKIMISRMMDYNNNPTAENKKKLMGTFMRTAFMTALYVTAIDGLKAMITHGFDDKEEVFSFTAHSVFNNMAGYYHGIGTLARMVSSRIDKQPWTSELQHPVEAMLGDMADAGASIIKGDFSRAFKQVLLTSMQYKGIPGYPVKFGWNLYDRATEPTDQDKAELKTNPDFINDTKSIDLKYDDMLRGVQDEEDIKDIKSDKRKEKSELRKSYL